ETATPHRTGVDGVDAATDVQPERRPVAADHLEVALYPPGHREPGIQPRRLGAGRALVLVRNAPPWRAVAHPGTDVDDRPVPVVALQPRIPDRAIPVHVAQQPLVVRAVQHGLHLQIGRAHV